MKWKKDHKMPNSKLKLNGEGNASGKRKNSSNNDEFDSDASNLDDSKYDDYGESDNEN